MPATNDRVLVISITPPVPMDQGNRAVTGKLVHRLLDQGFDVDMLLQSGLDTAAATRAFGTRVRFVRTPGPPPADPDEMAVREDIRKFAKYSLALGPSQSVARELFDAANHFHPFQTLSDQTVEAGLRMVKETHYRAIICNYTYSLRVIYALRTALPQQTLPPIAVLTHDALSRLDEQAWTLGIQTQMRACTPATERDALNLSDTVVAISQTEADYFRDIGVSRPIILSEYEAVTETAPYRITADNATNRRIVFAGSRNDLNYLGIQGFLENVWPDVRAAVPGAELAICGTVCERLPTDTTDGVTLHGPLDRPAMLTLLGSASAAINPTVGGTGLKIKTVEAICLGLPSVVTSNAAEGMETLDGQAFHIANGPEAMRHYLVELLQGGPQWLTLHHGALAAMMRFSAEAVYEPLERALGLNRA